MTDQPTQPALLQPPAATPTGPVTCLGLTFASDAARRAHFTALLAEKLKEPAFRQIEGFPIGTDEDILALSDPPYYTMCPNPWLADFVAEWESQKPPKPEGYVYHREPFAADVSEGKNDPIYNAHSYHTKVPHKAIMRYILHYTEPGDIVFDGFCGTGMTGVAAYKCGDREAVTSLGYQVDGTGNILRQEIDTTGKLVWKPFARLGERRAVLNDLSPAATSIAYNYNVPHDVARFQNEAQRILNKIGVEYGWMYETQHAATGEKGIINFVVWSEVNSCPECLQQFVFYHEALDAQSKRLREIFACPHCGVELKKGRLNVITENTVDRRLNSLVKLPVRVPVLINYSIGRKKYEKLPDAADLALLDRINNLPRPVELPATELPEMQMTRVGRMQSSGITHIHHFFLSRPALILGSMWKMAGTVQEPRVRALLRFWIDSQLVNLSVRNRYRPEVSFPYNPLTGVFYVPSIVSEPCLFPAYENKVRRIMTALSGSIQSANNLIQTCSAGAEILQAASQDYIFTDPPFGENIYYSDLNFFVESWYKVFTNTDSEAIVDRVKKKALADYRDLIRSCFKEYYRILKPGRWITVEFSNSQASVWNVIQTTLQEVGFVVSGVAALDKQQRSFQSVTSPTAVKQDLVISAYKPNGGFEERFVFEALNEEGVWDFVRTHLQYLTVVRYQGALLQIVPERDPRILYDQMVAFYVRKGYSVPLDSQEFQAGLEQRFSFRDGMYFLPEQVVEYDKKRLMAIGVEQAALFVSDESSAIAWLRQLLRQKPQTFQDINPQFMKELGGWNKNEETLELSTLLEQNFLIYDGIGPVPEQVHAYLSSNWREMRSLAKDDPELVAKARNRWYVPDPNKAIDLEKMREKALLKDFDEYRQAKKKIKVFRLEAVRAGFKRAWQARDYATIIAVAEKIPEDVLQEDPKLLMWYDQAQTRSGVA